MKVGVPFLILGEKKGGGGDGMEDFIGSSWRLEDIFDP